MSELVYAAVCLLAGAAIVDAIDLGRRPARSRGETVRLAVECTFLALVVPAVVAGSLGGVPS